MKRLAGTYLLVCGLLYAAGLCFAQLPMTHAGLGAPAGGACSMAFDAVGPTGSPPGFSIPGTAGTVFSFTHPGGSSATAVAVGIQTFGATISSITYGGTSMSQAATVTDGNGTVNYLYGLTNLGGLGLTGSQTVQLTFSSSGPDAEAGSISVSCSNTTTTFDQANSAQANSSTPSVTVNSTTAEIVVDELGATSGAGTITATASGQNIRWGPIAVGGNKALGSTTPGAATSTTPAYSFSGGSAVWGMTAASFKHQ